MVNCRQLQWHQGTSSIVMASFSCKLYFYALIVLIQNEFHCKKKVELLLIHALLVKKW